MTEGLGDLEGTRMASTSPMAMGDVLAIRVPSRSPNPSVIFSYRGARRNGRRARVGEIASRSTQYLPGAIGHRAAVSEHREPFAGGAGDAAGPNSSATHPASVRTAIAGIKQMLYGNFY